MFKDNAFRICLIASVAVHFGMMMPWPFLNFLLKQPKATLPKIEMTYFSKSRLPQMSVKSNKPHAAAESSTGADIKSSNDLTPAKTPENDIVAKRREEKKPNKEDMGSKKEEGSRSIILKDKKDEKAEIVEIETCRGAVYDQYYLDVREKIRAAIERNKNGILRESEVGIKFVLDRNGNLKGLFLYRSTGPDANSLEKLAIKSIKEASPFPSFDEKIKEKELQFNLPIKVVSKPR